MRRLCERLDRIDERLEWLQTHVIRLRRYFEPRYTSRRAPQPIKRPAELPKTDLDLKDQPVA